MESAEIYRHKLEQLEKAVTGFENLMGQNTSSLNEILADGIKNGRIQKFEYCAELMWKTVRYFLIVNEGTSASSPKSVIKEFHLAGYCNEPFYESLIGIIQDRNLLSHVYREKIFDEVTGNLKRHLDCFKKLIGILKK